MPLKNRSYKSRDVESGLRPAHCLNVEILRDEACHEGIVNLFACLTKNDLVELLDIDFNNVRKKKPMYVPKILSRTQAYYFTKPKIDIDSPSILIEKIDTTKNTKSKTVKLTDEGSKDFKDFKLRGFIRRGSSKYVDEGDCTKRDDLLHKKNLENYNELFKKKKEYMYDIFNIDNILNDLNWEDL